LGASDVSIREVIWRRYGVRNYRPAIRRVKKRKEVVSKELLRVSSQAWNWQQMFYGLVLIVARSSDVDLGVGF